MMLCRDARRRWMQYGENRKQAYEDATFDESPLRGMYYGCTMCNELMKKKEVEIDHEYPLGPRPRTFDDYSGWLEKLFEYYCVVLCKSCHRRKTNAERKRRAAKDISI